MESQNLLTIVRWTTVIIFFSWLYFYYQKLKSEKAFEMNSGPLTKQRLFWASIIAPVMGFFAFGFVVWVDHHPQLDGDGLNNFIEISKLPLAILSLSGFLGVIVNNVHRTIQTNEQIEEAQRKNKNDLYYSHQKNTIELIEKINKINFPFKEQLEDSEKNTYEIAIKNPLKLYRKIFTKLSNNNFQLDIDTEFTYNLNKSLLRVRGHIFNVKLHNKFKNTGYELEIAKSFHEIDREIKKLAFLLEIDPAYRTYSFSRKFETHTLITYYSEEAELICIIYYYFEIVDSLCTVINLKPLVNPYFIFGLPTLFDTIFKSEHFNANKTELSRGVYENKLST